MELLSEVLNHVVSFWFTVDQKIHTDLLLEANNNFNLFLDELLIFGFGDLAFAEFSASLTDLLGLL
jgi:hypothetical protein